METDIATLKKTRVEIAANGYASATLASSGGSKSYTRLSLDQLTTLIGELTAELKKYRTMLRGEAGIQPESVAIIYS